PDRPGPAWVCGSWNRRTRSCTNSTFGATPPQNTRWRRYRLQCFLGAEAARGIEGERAGMKRGVEALTGETFDLLILGGGITGAGVALDAALRGYRVALIDKGDFASGTSSVSSKLVHGGLRYLEHGDFRLVYEALHERRLLLHNAPHLVHPLRFIVPFFRGDRVRPLPWRAGRGLFHFLSSVG